MEKISCGVRTRWLCSRLLALLWGQMGVCVDRLWQHGRRAGACNCCCQFACWCLCAFVCVYVCCVLIWEWYTQWPFVECGETDMDHCSSSYLWINLLKLKYYKSPVFETLTKCECNSSPTAFGNGNFRLKLVWSQLSLLTFHKNKILNKVLKYSRHWKTYISDLTEKLTSFKTVL